MSDYKWNNKVVQANQFVRQSYNNLKGLEIKVLDTLVSCVDTMHPKTKIEITKSELAKAIGMRVDNNYTYVKQSLQALLNETWSFTTSEYQEYRHFLERVRWYYYEDRVEVEFHKDILPMLVDLKNNFLVYSAYDLNYLKSRYTMILYKYILSYIKQYKTTDFEIPYEELKKVLNVSKNYARFDNFNNRVLKPFVSEVNNSKCLPYLVSYSKVIGNRKVVAIHFVVRARTDNEETLFSDIHSPILLEEYTNKLINGNTPIEEIKNRQVDAFKKEIETKKQEQENQNNNVSVDNNPFY